MKEKALVLLKRYRSTLTMLLLLLLLLIIRPITGRQAVTITATNLQEMLVVFPPIFILLGLLDVWVERETMIKLMGEGSGFRGFLLALLLGSAAAGPLYTAFPVAVMMMKKGCSLFNVFLFVGAWSTTKIPMFTFEMESMGIPFALTRLCCSFVGITLIALLLDKSLKTEEKFEIYHKAKQLSAK